MIKILRMVQLRNGKSIDLYNTMHLYEYNNSLKGVNVVYPTKGLKLYKKELDFLYECNPNLAYWVSTARIVPKEELLELEKGLVIKINSLQAKISEIIKGLLVMEKLVGIEKIINTLQDSIEHVEKSLVIYEKIYACSNINQVTESTIVYGFKGKYKFDILDRGSIASYCRGIKNRPGLIINTGHSLGKRELGFLYELSYKDEIPVARYVKREELQHLINNATKVMRCYEIDIKSIAKKLHEGVYVNSKDLMVKDLKTKILRLEEELAPKYDAIIDKLIKR
ncbi:hypothetical protein D3C81_10770 [compost metagenome]